MRQAFALYRHDLRRIFRTSRTFELLVASVAGTALVTLTVWPPPDSALRFGDAARKTVQGFAAAEFALLLLLVPVLAISVLRGERDRNVWDLLATSLIRPGHFALARAGALATVALVALGATTPLVATLHLLGGLSLSELLQVILVLAAAGVSSAVIAVAVAFDPKQPGKVALERVVFALLLFEVFIPMLASDASPRSPGELSFLACAYGAGLTFVFGKRLRNYVVWPGAEERRDVAGARERSAPRSATLPVRAEKPLQSEARAPRSAFARYLLRRAELRPTSSFANPIFLTALVTGNLGSRPWARWMGGVIFFGALFFHDGSWTALVAICIAAPASSLVLPRLRASGGIDSLRSSLLRSGDLVAGTFLSGLVAGSVFALAGNVGYFIELAVASGGKNWSIEAGPYLYPVISVSVLVTSAAVATFGASIAPDRTTALVFSYFVLCAWLGVVPILLALESLTGGFPWSVSGPATIGQYMREVPSLLRSFIWSQPRSSASDLDLARLVALIVASQAAVAMALLALSSLALRRKGFRTPKRRASAHGSLVSTREERKSSRPGGRTRR